MLFESMGQFDIDHLVLYRHLIGYPRCGFSSTSFKSVNLSNVSFNDVDLGHTDFSEAFQYAIESLVLAEDKKEVS